MPSIRIRMALAAGLLAVASLLSATAAQACQCAKTDRSAPAIFAAADVLFRGVALKDRATVRDRAPLIVTTFKVTEAFKGVKKGRTVAIGHRQGGGGACGVTFTTGESHTVKADRAGTDLWTSSCAMLGLIDPDPALLAQFRTLSQQR